MDFNEGLKKTPSKKMTSSDRPFTRIFGTAPAGGVAFGAVPASDSCPARGLDARRCRGELPLAAQACYVFARRTRVRARRASRTQTKSPVRMIRTALETCIAPRLSREPDVSLAGVPRWHIEAAPAVARRGPSRAGQLLFRSKGRREEHARGRRMAAGTKAQGTSSHCTELQARRTYPPAIEQSPCHTNSIAPFPTKRIYPRGHEPYAGMGL